MLSGLSLAWLDTERANAGSPLLSRILQLPSARAAPRTAETEWGGGGGGWKRKGGSECVGCRARQNWIMEMALKRLSLGMKHNYKMNLKIRGEKKPYHDNQPSSNESQHRLGSSTQNSITPHSARVRWSE